MASEIEATTRNKRKRVSKKSKKAWRKHVDTKDVDLFLDDLRLEERLGLRFSERRDDELFQVDEKGANKETASIRRSSNKSSKSLKSLETKCFSSLENSSAVQDPIRKRNRVRTREEKKPTSVKEKEAARIKQGILKPKEVHAKKQYELYLSSLRKKNKLKPDVIPHKFSKDLWGVSEPVNSLGQIDEWLRPETLIHNLKSLGKLKKKMTKNNFVKPSCIPAVETPHPGISYNPSYGDHQNLLQEVTESELAIIKEEKHLNRVTSKMFKHVTEKERQEMWLDEMSGCLPKAGGKTPEEPEEDTNENEYKAVNPPVENKKKTLQKRRKLKEAKMEQSLLKKKRVEKKKISDIYRLRFLKQDIEKMDKKIQLLRDKRERIKEYKKDEPKRLAKLKYEAPFQPFNMANDIKGNLLLIKPEGSIMQDRFYSLQKRNILQPTKPQARKKGKVKRYEVKSHKMGWEPKGY